MSDVAARQGAHAQYDVHARHDALARHGTDSIAKGSKSFAAAARLFDAETRRSAVLLYAWCRHCDDVIDGQVSGHRDGIAPPSDAAERLVLLERLTRDALSGGAVADPAFAGLQEVVARHAIPERLPLRHLEGYRMDVEGRRYATLGDTLDYSYHVAGVVGVMMARIMGVRDEAVLDRASDLGLAFQLTNIARDIVEDAGAGRVYLPEGWLAEAGIPPGEVARPQHRASLAGVAARLLDEAERYYASSAVGIAALPRRSAWAVATARDVYRQIGIEVKARGPSAWDGRVSTTTAQKLRFVAQGAVTALTSRTVPVPERSGLYDRPR